MGQAPDGARGQNDFPVPAARDESHPQANGDSSPSLTVSAPRLNLEYPQALTTVIFPAKTAGTAIHTLWIVLWTTS